MLNRLPVKSMMAPFVVFLLVMASSAVRSGRQADLEREQESDCTKSLLVRYDGLNGNDIISGAFRLMPGHWDNATVFTKTWTAKDGDLSEGICTETFTAMCKTGKMKVSLQCTSGKSSRPVFWGLRDHQSVVVHQTERVEAIAPTSLVGLMKHESDQISPGTKLVFSASDVEGVQMTSGKLFWEAVNQGSVKLRSISQFKETSPAQGCYCCKRRYNELLPVLHDPFDSGEAYLDNNCLIAWSLEERDRVLPWILKTTYQAVNLLTFGVTQRVACQATCPFREAEFAENQWSYARVYD